MIQSEKRSLACRAAVVCALGAALVLTGCTTPAGHADEPHTTPAASASAGQHTAGATAQQKVTPVPESTGRSTPVPVPSGGSIDEVIPEATPGPITQVGLNDTAELPNEIAINIEKVEAIETKATTPGEIAGPAVAMYVSIHNGSAKTINIDSVIVNLTDSADGLGQPTTSDPYQPFAGELAAGKSVEGVYVFLVPTDNRRGLTLSVEYAAGQASAHFVGDVS